MYSQQHKQLRSQSAIYFDQPYDPNRGISRHRETNGPQNIYYPRLTFTLININCNRTTFLCSKRQFMRINQNTIQILHDVSYIYLLKQNFSFKIVRLLMISLQIIPITQISMIAHISILSNEQIVMVNNLRKIEFIQASKTVPKHKMHIDVNPNLATYPLPSRTFCSTNSVCLHF